MPQYRDVAWCNGCQGMRPWRMVKENKMQPWLSQAACQDCNGTITPTLEQSPADEERLRYRGER